MVYISQDIKFDVWRWMQEFSKMVIVWSDMVARTTWRMARSFEGVNRARREINREVSKFMVKNGGLAIRHLELEFETWRYLRRDGVHLNDVGIDLWALGLQDGIQRAIWVWRCTQKVRLLPLGAVAGVLVFAGERRYGTMRISGTSVAMVLMVLMVVSG